jgi:hypothetical protein
MDRGQTRARAKRSKQASKASRRLFEAASLPHAMRDFLARQKARKAVT